MWPIRGSIVAHYAPIFRLFCVTGVSTPLTFVATAPPSLFSLCFATQAFFVSTHKTLAESAIAVHIIGILSVPDWSFLLFCSVFSEQCVSPPKIRHKHFYARNPSWQPVYFDFSGTANHLNEAGLLQLFQQNGISRLDFRCL